MTPLFGEFASHEFATVEFGLENASFILNADFVFAGSSATAWEIQQGVVAHLVSSAAATVAINATVLKNAVAAGSGQGSSIWEVQQVLAGEMTTYGIGAAGFAGGCVIKADLLSEAGATVFWQSADGNAFSVLGKSIVVFDTAATHTVGFAAAASSQAFYSGIQVQYGDFIFPGTAQTDLDFDHVLFAELSITGGAASLLRSQTTNHGDMLSVAQAASMLKGQQILLSGLQIAGQSTIFWNGQVWALAGMTATGKAVYVPYGNSVISGYLITNGTSAMVVKPGSVIVLDFPPAADQIIRPYEDRGAVWK